MASKVREVVLPLCTGETPAKHCLQLRSPQYGKDMDLSERVQRRARKMVRGLDHLSYQDRLRDLGLFGLEKTMLQGNLIAVFQYLKETYKKRWGQAF